MAALRAMLQLRSGPSSPHLSAIHSHSDSHALHSHPASTLQLSNTAPYTSSVLSTPLLSPMTGISAPTKQSGSNTNKKALNLGLHSGAASGNLGLVKFALDNGQPIDSVLNGVLPIHAACCSNANVPVVLFLIDRGADVNARRHARKYNGEKAQSVGTTGSTPLHFAAANGCLTIVEILLRHGAIADSADKYGTTPFMVATARNHPDVASVLHQHSSMQRGIQVLTPEADLRDIRDRDLFTSPRSSGDFSRRVSAIMAPTRSSGILQKDSPSTSLALQTSPPQITTAISTATATMSRSIVSQRRVSLPCIIESPTSPMGPATPRHSCDLPKSPMYAEPLHTRTTSGALRRDCMPAAQKANATPTASLLTTRPQPQKTQPQTLGGRQTNNNPKDQSSKQKSASVQQHSPLDKVASSWLFAGVPEAISNNVSRRRSIDISALSVLASRTSLHLRRQRSLDLLGAQTPVPAPVVAEAAAAVPDPTAAASSYADPAVTDEDSRQPESKIRRDSDASTSETIVSGQSSCATLVNPMMQVLDDGKPPVQDSIEKTPANPMARSTSQPPLSHTSVSSAARRSASASEPSVRQSFDLRLFAGRDRLGMEEDEQHEALNKNRRRSIHDPLFTMKEEPEIGPRLLGMSSLQNETLSHLSRKGSVSSSSSTSKSRGSFSGSATVSGRFSRFLWYGSDHHSTSASNMGPDHSFWNSSSSGVGDLAETNNSTEAIHQETGERKTRTGMMNRLSGIWSRR